VIALGTPRELIARIGGEQIIDFRIGENEIIDQDALIRLPTATRLRKDDDLFSLTVSEPRLAVPALLDFLRENGQSLADLTIRSATLEDVFVTLTGRHLRDDK